MIFDLKNSDIYQAVKISKLPLLGCPQCVKKFSLLVFIISFAIFSLTFLGGEKNIYFLGSIFGLALFSLSLTLFFWQFSLFFESRLKQPQLPAKLNDIIENPESFNLADFFDFETALIMTEAESLSRKKNLPFDATAITFAMLLSKKRLQLPFFVLNRLLINPKDIANLIKDYWRLKQSSNGQRLSNDFFLDTVKNSIQKGNLRISSGDLLAALAKHDPILAEVFVRTDNTADDVNKLSWWWETFRKELSENRKFWLPKNLAQKGGLAKNFAAGYTVLLDTYSIDLTESLRKRGFGKIIGHQKEVEQIERVLARQDANNVLVVGEEGSGRGALIQALAQKIFFGESFPELNHKRVVSLDLVGLVNRCQNQEKASAVLEQIAQETLRAGNIVIVINDIHNFLSGAKTKPGAIDISGTLTPYLRMPNFRVVAVTDFSNFHKFVEGNQISSLFEKVEIAEISPEETISLIELLIPGWEKRYGKFISYPAVKTLVIKSARYLPSIPFPKKATELMAELLTSVSRTEKRVILPADVDKLISEKTMIPIGQLASSEKDTLLNLENLIHERIINQEEAVKEVASALRRARADITIRKGPMGTFLFLGPTGVGKTETAKALASIYFGSEEKIIRLDMSEFQNLEDLHRLIGSNEENSFFLNDIKERPFSLVLLDEIEKAHPNILNLFLQILDEGSMRDGLGRPISFTNTIIIATSNAGYQIILEAISQGAAMPSIKEKLLSHIFEKGIFRPEFINRFDAIVVFKSLTEDNLLKIADLLLKKLKNNLAEKGIEFLVSEELKQEIVRLGFDPVFGARQMRRVIQDRVENVLASALLAGQIGRGDKVTIKVPEFELQVLYQ
ncbi:MAG: ATP-dependent Clp protease ATP-binding subunit [bacterium]|nr:ATP-dependent Clp protease ATP-binding subunit [bacterium]